MIKIDVFSKVRRRQILGDRIQEVEVNVTWVPCKLWRAVNYVLSFLFFFVNENVGLDKSIWKAALEFLQMC